MARPDHLHGRALAAPGAAVFDRLLALPDGARRLAADAAVLATAAAVIALFALSPEMLESFGIDYVTSGGGVLGKLHPATYLAILALALRCAATRRPLATAWRLLTGDAGVMVLLAATAVTAAYAIFVSHSPFTGLIDTFVLPVLVLLLLRDLHPVVLRWIALAVVAVLCVNAVMAIVELLGQFHVMRISVPDGATSDPTRGDGTFDWRAQLALEWRATALLGHPLSNGLIVGCFLVCLAAEGSRWIPPAFKVPLVILQAASMFAFGARTSLVLTVVFAGLLLARQGAAALARGARPTTRTLSWVMLGAVLLVVAGGAVLASGLADRTIERFGDDAGSARSRVTMFDVVQTVPWAELVMGPDQEAVATAQRIYGLEFGIESSWVGLLLTYGLLITAIVMIGLAAFSRSVVRACGPGALSVIAVYFIAVSGMASLSGKTTSFAMIVVLALLLLPRAEPRGSPRPA